MTLPPIMTIEEVANYLRVSERSVYEWAKKGDIPCGKIGTSWRFIREDVEDWVQMQVGRSRPVSVAQDMRISQVLTPDHIIVSDSATKNEALDTLIGLLTEDSTAAETASLRRGIYRREALLSTGLSMGVALPHVRLAEISEVVMAVGIYAQGIADYETLDGEPVHAVFMLAAGENQHAQYLQITAALMALVKDSASWEALQSVTDATSAYFILTHGSDLVQSGK